MQRRSDPGARQGRGRGAGQARRTDGRQPDLRRNLQLAAGWTMRRPSAEAAAEGGAPYDGWTRSLAAACSIRKPVKPQSAERNAAPAWARYFGRFWYMLAAGGRLRRRRHLDAGDHPRTDRSSRRTVSSSPRQPAPSASRPAPQAQAQQASSTCWLAAEDPSTASPADRSSTKLYHAGRIPAARPGDRYERRAHRRVWSA